MESEGGYEQAKDWNETIKGGSSTFLGGPIEVVPSPEPSDIIWEN